MTFAAALVAEREHDFRVTARRSDRARIRDGVGDRLVEEHMLAGGGSSARGLKVHVVRRGVDDRFDAFVAENFFVGY